MKFVFEIIKSFNMFKIPSLTAIAVVAASSVLADDYGDFDYFIPAEPYEGSSFEVDVPCAERAVKEYTGNVQYFNSETGIIYAGNDDIHAFVALEGEKPESDLATVSWIEVATPHSESHINYINLDGPFSNAAYNKGIKIEGQFDARTLEDLLKTCTPAKQALALS